MSRPHIQGPFIIEVQKSGLLSTSITKGLALWEMGSDDGMKADHVVIDAAQSASTLQYEEIPAVINFLKRVYEQRVVNDDRTLQVCPHCKQRYDE